MDTITTFAERARALVAAEEKAKHYQDNAERMRRRRECVNCAARQDDTARHYRDEAARIAAGATV